MNNALPLSDWMQQHQQRIETVLDDRLSKQDQHTSAQLLEAMRYSTLNGASACELY